MQVERAHADVGGGRDLSDAGVVETARGEDAPGGGEQVGAPRALFSESSFMIEC